MYPKKEPTQLINALHDFCTYYPRQFATHMIAWD